MNKIRPAGFKTEGLASGKVRQPRGKSVADESVGRLVNKAKEQREEKSKERSCFIK
jgi:hypothetical protein